MSDQAFILEDAADLLEQAEQAYFHWQPRPDQLERYDQQTGFVNSKAKGVIWLVGGNGAGTSESACHKIARFVFETPPPRHDTPFWVISESYEMVMESAWKEKLLGHGHIPKSEVDWDRISWYKETNGWPFRVPLKAWPGRPHKNWTLEFKSYGQGRAQMQARSIGGFCFMEQFPYEILTEVLRGCREYNFPGSKFCEFTPIDPGLSEEIFEMIDGINGKRLPDGWEVYRLNTECAMEAGHVSKTWFTEFFGMVSDELLETRLIGSRPVYEGSVYKGFNPAVHVVTDDQITHPEGVHYRRAIDWGFGPENAFCCLYGYRNGWGQWCIFDEYYSTDQQKTVLDHLENIKEKHPDVTFGTNWADPSSPDNIRIAGRYGFPIMSANNAVIEGIEYVRAQLKKCPANGQPKLLIHGENCPNLCRQMRTYRWRKGTQSSANPTDAKKEPLKKDDHAVDALRYMLFSEAVLGGLKPDSARRDVDYKRNGVLLEQSTRFRRGA